jgi:lysophospholipase L1-like esterase
VSDLAPRVDERILRFRPDAVFLMFGTNDASRGAAALSAYVESYRTVIDRLRSAGLASVIVQTAVPMMPIDADGMVAIARWEPTYDAAAWRSRTVNRLSSLAAYVEATRALARDRGLPLVDHWTAWEQVGHSRGQMMDGYVHPNEFGHRFMAHTLFRACGLWDDRSEACRLFVPV